MPEQIQRVRFPEEPYKRIGTPEKGSPKPVSAKRLMVLMQNSEFREAVRRCGKAEGHVKAVSLLWRNQLMHKREADMHAREQALAIKLQKDKLAGKLQDEYDVWKGAKEELAAKVKRDRPKVNPIFFVSKQ